MACLREYVPLKQGLRLALLKRNLLHDELREYVPLKQGLRLLCCSCISHNRLREYVPLKQGLRRQ